ncbi:MAG: ABC-2 transporter permease [Blautia sp.]|nr:ABC-2 transporter permease [Blautia sp.]
MRTFKFAKIDLMRVKKMKLWILALFPVISVILTMNNNSTPYFGLFYCVFGGMILGTLPFNLETREEAGFVRMLPSKPGDQVLGHFIFGFCTVFVCILLGVGSLAAARLLDHSFSRQLLSGRELIGASCLTFALCLVCLAAGDLIFTVTRFETVKGMTIVRIIPPFLFLFGANFLLETDQGLLRTILELLLWGNGLAALAVSIVLFCIVAVIAARISAAKWEG